MVRAGGFLVGSIGGFALRVGDAEGLSVFVPGVVAEVDALLFAVDEQAAEGGECDGGRVADGFERVAEPFVSVVAYADKLGVQVEAEGEAEEGSRWRTVGEDVTKSGAFASDAESLLVLLGR